MKKISFVMLVGTMVATSAVADCPAKPPSIEGRFPLDQNDKRVDKSWLEKNISGRQVRFNDGTEHYGTDGSYHYTSGSQRWDAKGYVFYSNGLRCIDYPDPRFDLYVVNDGRLVLINGGGERFFGKVVK